MTVDENKDVDILLKNILFKIFVYSEYHNKPDLTKTKLDLVNHKA